MADFYQKIVEMQGGVEDLVRKVPGFKGYFEKQDRRKADRLLREQLARVFEEQLGEFGRLQKQLINAGGIGYMERVQSIDTRMRTFIDRIESAAQGYAGLFDAVKVKEDALQRVYAFDSALLVYQDQFAAGLENFAEAIGTEELDGVLMQLDDLVTEMNNTFKRRVEAMQGLQDAV
jgi:hypothetical protein